MTKFQKSICLILSFMLCLTAFSYGAKFNVNSDTIKIGYISGSNVNIREKASTSSKSVIKVSNVIVDITDTVEDANATVNDSTGKAYLWYKVSYTSLEKTVTGYVREDLIVVRECEIDDAFKEKLKDFPESYHNSLILLHAIYPNWEFVADKVPLTFDEAVALEDNLFYKLVQSSYNSLRSMRKGCYDWSSKKFVETDSGGWYGASREVISYYMDPRNFLNPNDIFLFMRQSYDSKTQTVAGIEEIVKGSFLDAEITDKNDKYYGKRYAAVIRYAGSQSRVNAYVLASTILQEQGIKGATLSKGTTYNNKKVYNFFNFGASGSTESQVLNNGKKYAYEQEWFTPTASIVGGATKYGSGYISAGQDTYFYKNYNILNPDNIWHQYAQNVADSHNTAKFLKTAYAGKFDMGLIFRIPVYKKLPQKVCLMPEKSDKLNNYYFSTIEATGLTPSFNRYTFEYAMSVEGDTEIYVKAPSGAKYKGKEEFTLKKGENSVELIVESQTGYKNTYILNVEALNSCKLYVKTEKNQTAVPEEKLVKGDTNGDSKVTTSDLANVRLHLLKKITLKENGLKSADTNGDGNITTSDLANIRLHLLKLITLK